MSEEITIIGFAIFGRYRGDMTEVYKFINGIYTSGYGFLPRAVALRGHEYKLKKIQCRSQQRWNFFSFRVVNLWNILPGEVISTPSMNTCKQTSTGQTVVILWIQKSSYGDKQ